MQFGLALPNRCCHNGRAVTRRGDIRGNPDFDLVRAYGPYGVRVQALVDRCRLLTPAELVRLQESLQADFLSRTEEARVAAIQAAEAAGRSRAWTAALRAVGDAVEDAVPGRMAGDLSGAVYAVPAWVALAVIVGDLVTRNQRDVLVSGWLDAGLPAP